MEHNLTINVPYHAAHAIADKGAFNNWLQNNRGDYVPGIVSPVFQVRSYRVIGSKVEGYYNFLVVETVVDDNPQVVQHITFNFPIDDSDIYDTLRRLFKNEDVWELLTDNKDTPHAIEDVEFSHPHIMGGVSTDGLEKEPMEDSGLYAFLEQVNEEHSPDYSFSFATNREGLRLEIKVEWWDTVPAPTAEVEEEEEG